VARWRRALPPRRASHQAPHWGHRDPFALPAGVRRYECDHGASRAQPADRKDAASGGASRAACVLHTGGGRRIPGGLPRCVPASGARVPAGPRRRRRPSPGPLLCPHERVRPDPAPGRPRGDGAVPRRPVARPRRGRRRRAVRGDRERRRAPPPPRRARGRRPRDRRRRRRARRRGAPVRAGARGGGPALRARGRPPARRRARAGRPRQRLLAARPRARGRGRASPARASPPTRPTAARGTCGRSPSPTRASACCAGSR
jgi:hypothetical protein